VCHAIDFDNAKTEVFMRKSWCFALLLTGCMVLASGGCKKDEKPKVDVSKQPVLKELEAPKIKEAPVTEGK